MWFEVTWPAKFPLAPCAASLFFFPKDESRFWAYMVASKSGTLYTGMTNGIERRIFEHKHHLIPGFTDHYNCTRLVWFEEHSDVRDAIARENQIKGWLRARKIALIEEN